MRSILDVPRVASGSRRDKLPDLGVRENRMSAGPKSNSKKSISPGQPGSIPDQIAAAVQKIAATHPGSSMKSGKPERKAEFGQATYYRQGVLVPGGPHKSPMPRSRSR
jgi:hypothetical protein